MKNKDKIKETHKRWVSKNRKYLNRKARLYRKNNREKILARERNYRAKNRDRLNKQNLEYYHEHKKIINRNKRLRLKLGKNVLLNGVIENPGKALRSIKTNGLYKCYLCGALCEGKKNRGHLYCNECLP